MPLYMLYPVRPLSYSEPSSIRGPAEFLTPLSTALDFAPSVVALAFEFLADAVGISYGGRLLGTRSFLVLSGCRVICLPITRPRVSRRGLAIRLESRLAPAYNTDKVIL